MGEYVWLVPSVAFLVAAIGWLLRELHFRRERKIKATTDATKILKDQIADIEKAISKTDDISRKKELLTQLDRKNDQLRGLSAINLRRTLKDADLSEDMLIEEGKTPLQPQQVNELKQEIAAVESLPLSDSIPDLLTLANAYYYAEQYEDAKDIYDRTLNLNPDDQYALTNRGVTYAKLERYDEALADYNRSLELRPDDPTVLSNRGNTYGKLGKYDEALADFNRSLELRPNDPVTLNNRGIAYSKLERYDEALADYTRSLELRPDDPATLYNLACLFSLWEKPEKSIDYLKKAISLNKKWREYAKTDKDFDNIRKDPRFKKLVGEN